MMGSNDQTDAVSLIYSIEKIVKIGIISSSTSSNVNSSSIPVDVFAVRPKYIKPVKPKFYNFKFPAYIRTRALWPAGPNGPPGLPALARGPGRAVAVKILKVTGQGGPWHPKFLFFGLGGHRADERTGRGARTL